MQTADFADEDDIADGRSFPLLSSTLWSVDKTTCQPQLPDNTHVTPHCILIILWSGTFFLNTLTFYFETSFWSSDKTTCQLQIPTTLSAFPYFSWYRKKKTCVRLFQISSSPLLLSFNNMSWPILLITLEHALSMRYPSYLGITILSTSWMVEPDLT